MRQFANCYRCFKKLKQTFQFHKKCAKVKSMFKSGYRNQRENNTKSNMSNKYSTQKKKDELKSTARVFVDEFGHHFQICRPDCRVKRCTCHNSSSCLSLSQDSARSDGTAQYELGRIQNWTKPNEGYVQQNGGIESTNSSRVSSFAKSGRKREGYKQHTEQPRKKVKFNRNIEAYYCQECSEKQQYWNPTLGKYKCKDCERTYKDFNTLLLHQQSHADKVCAKCSDKFTASPAAARRSKFLSHKKRQCKCRDCEYYSTVYKCALKNRKIANKRTYPCPFCNASFCSSSELEEHCMRTHVKKAARKRKYACGAGNPCKRVKRSMLKRDLRGHAHACGTKCPDTTQAPEVQLIAPYVCPTCKRGFASLAHFRGHKHLQSTLKPHPYTPALDSDCSNYETTPSAIECSRPKNYYLKQNVA